MCKTYSQRLLIYISWSLEVKGNFDAILNSTCGSLEVERKFGSVLTLLCIVRHKPEYEKIVIGFNNQHKTLSNFYNMD